MKRWISLLLVLAMILPLAACNKENGNEDQKTETTEEENVDQTETDDTESTSDGKGKIGIVTGTVSQGEEEFRAGEKWTKELGDRVIHVTYPDKFAQEQETTIANMKSLAADKDVKAMIIVQAVPGTAAGIDAVREMRPDMLIIAGAPHDDPEVIASRADICLDLDQYQRGVDIIDTAKDMGAETFIHYSFPRHMSYVLLAARRDELQKRAEEVGMDFYEVDAPDPTGDAGISGAQQFVLEDAPRQVEKYGENTAFFSTNCSMQEPLIKAVLEEGAIFPEQCCPSPYHAYPGALGIKIPQDKAGDIEYLNDQIKEAVAEKGGTGRFATWKYPANVLMIDAGVAYAEQFINGDVEAQDIKAMEDILEKETDGDVKINLMDDLDNFILLTISSQTF
ncbi:MAG: DUF3798 domain-containing protein [Tissierellia bacterium]|nr:DUF3798 domain-containing protein [Tissierellia bacterium]